MIILFLYLLLKNLECNYKINNIIILISKYKKYEKYI